MRIEYTHEEHVALAEAYAFMATEQEAGRKVNKAQLARDLQAGACAVRTRGAIEAKWMNMSAVAVEFGLLPNLPDGYVKGYKPAPNYGKALITYLQDALLKAYLRAA